MSTLSVAPPPNVLSLLHLMDRAGSMTAKFLLQYGKAFPVLPLPPTLRKGALKRCYQNAFEAVIAHRRKYYYAEGYGICSPLLVPLEHAWVIDNSGNAYDPTWEHQESSVYFGVGFRFSYVLSAAYRSRHYGLLGNAYDRCRLERRPGEAKKALLKAYQNKLSDARKTKIERVETIRKQIDPNATTVQFW